MDNLFFSKSEIACIGDGTTDYISSCRSLFQTSLSCLSSQLNTFLRGVGKGIELINYIHSDIFYVQLLLCMWEMTIQKSLLLVWTAMDGVMCFRGSEHHSISPYQAVRLWKMPTYFLTWSHSLAKVTLNQGFWVTR